MKGIIPGQLDNGVGGDPGPFFGPVGRLGLIVFTSHNIFLKPIKAGGVFFNKLVIIEVFFDQDIGHGDEQGRIRGRPDGNPFRGQMPAGGIQPGVHTNKGGPILLGLVEIMDRIRAEARLQGVPSPEDDQFGMEKVIPGILVIGCPEGHLGGKKSPFQRGVAPGSRCTRRRGKRSGFRFRCVSRCCAGCSGNRNGPGTKRNQAHVDP